MAIDAPVILSALFFTIIGIIVASAFLARKSAPNKPKAKQQETVQEGAAEYYESKAEVDASALVLDGKVKEVVDPEDGKEDPSSVPLAIEEIGIADEPSVVEAELSPVQEAQIQAAVVPEVACGKEAFHDPTPVDVFTSELEPLNVPASEPETKRMPVDTVPELIPESAHEEVSELPAQEPTTEVDSEHDSEPAPEPVSEPSSEPVSESSSETVSELIPEHVLEAIAEQVSKAIAEQVSEGIAEQISEGISMQVSEASAEQVSEAVSELAPEVVTEVTEHIDVATAPAECEAPSFKQGKKRTMKFEKAMTKDELEEEQRVQREQLAAIFKLLKENHETFGEVTEEDIEEQLKLYTY